MRSSHYRSWGRHPLGHRMRRLLVRFMRRTQRHRSRSRPLMPAPFPCGLPPRSRNLTRWNTFGAQELESDVARIAIRRRGCRHGRQQAGLGPEAVDPNRFWGDFRGGCLAVADGRDGGYLQGLQRGWPVRFLAAGAQTDGPDFPLGMLRLLPTWSLPYLNRAGIARGPNNTIYQSEISGLLALRKRPGLSSGAMPT